MRRLALFLSAAAIVAFCVTGASASDPKADLASCDGIKHPKVKAVCEKAAADGKDLEKAVKGYMKSKVKKAKEAAKAAGQENDKISCTDCHVSLKDFSLRGDGTKRAFADIPAKTKGGDAFTKLLEWAAKAPAKESYESQLRDFLK